MTEPQPGYGGVPVCHALSLAEVHTSIYVGESKGRRLLFIQDLNAVFFATLSLGPEERAEWHAATLTVR